jgi:Bacteriocin-protection, YdeI or OmpD-Associated/Domain of unknown function (DUF1905)
LFYPYTFEAPVERFGVGKVRKVWYNVLFLPADVRAALPFSQYPRLRVEGEIAEMPIANAFIPTGDGRNYVIVAPSVMKEAGVALGDVVEMRFRIADQDHVDVPEALALALQGDEAAQSAWLALTPGKQRMIVQHVLSAKTPATKQRRLDEALAAIHNFGGDINKWRRGSRP